MLLDFIAFPGLKSETLRLGSGQALGHPLCAV
jgi:hypothetical protein